MSTKHRQARSVLLIAALFLLAAVPVAQATYIGENGKISFDVYDNNGNPTVYTMNPDGSGRTPLVPGGAESAWSADGQRIAYACQATPNQVFFPRNTCTANATGAASPCSTTTAGRHSANRSGRRTARGCSSTTRNISGGTAACSRRICGGSTPRRRRPHSDCGQQPHRQLVAERVDRLHGGRAARAVRTPG